MLNALWLGFFVIAAVSALWRSLTGDIAVFASMVDSLFAMAKLSVEVMILLFGTLTLWLGFLKIAEKALLVQMLARWLSDAGPEVSLEHPAHTLNHHRGGPRLFAALAVRDAEQTACATWKSVNRTPARAIASMAGVAAARPP